MENTANLYKEANWTIPEDFMSKGHFERVVYDLDWTSSPGYPYCLTHPTNAAFFQVKNGIPNPSAVDYLWGLVQLRLEQRDADPIRLFIKPEPHKVKKLEEQRFRLISSISIVDQVIDQMIFGACNDAYLDNYPNIPSKAGWTQLKGGWKWVPNTGMACADKSSWDWTVPMWLLEMELNLRERLCLTKGNLLLQYRELAEWRYSKLFVEPMFVTSGGLFLNQKFPGVLKSGCINTIHANSVMQVMLHLLVCVRLGLPFSWLWAMGDDTMQEKPEKSEQYFKELEKYCILKQVEYKSEFAGHEFKDGRVEPSYFGKHCFSLLHADERYSNEMADSYSLLYHRSQKRDIIRTIVAQLADEKIPSLDVLDLIWDGDD
uniref:RNA-directed RNA polymerase C-terminal domain-containing protein n=1 Tax=Riboviria sp. TaxID=2585031 RepID=A0A8K1U2M2_9VIRU|nr:MAG: hypothetical protein 2 [Riboviria sp.]